MDTNRIAPSILKTRQHFEILDGLRGIAAFSIVTFHFMEWVYVDASRNFIGHGFLAVDFFFCLSGFVIAYAYDDRIAKMGVIEFFKSRLIRLQRTGVLFFYGRTSYLSFQLDDQKQAGIYRHVVFVVPGLRDAIHSLELVN